MRFIHTASTGMIFHLRTEFSGKLWVILEGSRESDSSYRIRRGQKLSLPNSCRIMSRLASVGCVRLAQCLFHEETKCAIIFETLT